MIILVLTVIVLISLFFGTAQGMAWDRIRQRRHRRGLTAPGLETEARA
jgi:hypothetical protein